MTRPQSDISPHAFRNSLQTALMIAGMFALLLALGVMLPGRDTLFYVLAAGLAALFVARRVAAGWVLRMYGARRIEAAEAPRLHWLIEELQQRAGIPVRPELYYIPSSAPNAFVVGTPREVSIALTDGLLRQLDLRELGAVFAHETAHVKHRDMYVMGLSDVLMRLTNALSLFGQLFLLVNLPLYFFGLMEIAFWPILLLIVAPNVAALLQSALSRTREFEADRAAVHLSGDPDALMTALQKIETANRNLLEVILMPGRRSPEPSALRTHPPLRQRLQRIAAEAQHTTLEHPPLIDARPRFMYHLHDDAHLPRYFERITRPPVWRVSGLWY